MIQIFKYSNILKYTEINIKFKLYPEIFLISFLYFVKFMLFQILKLIKYSVSLIIKNVNFICLNICKYKPMHRLIKSASK